MTAEGVFVGDVRDWAAGLAPESIQCVVTSPPYYGLRDYPIPPGVWGGAAGCAHAWGDEVPAPWLSALPGPGGDATMHRPGRRRARRSGRWCARCGAWLGRLGQEPTVALFVAHLVGVFAAIRPALRRDGTVWLNMGDGYAHRSARDGARRGSSDGGCRRGAPQGERVKAHGAIKHKDLLLVPFRLALALQEDGWYVREDIIWEKPNALPESVRDRPVRSHEYLFLLARSPRYRYDAAAISEPVTGTAHARGAGTTPKGATAAGRGNNSWQATTRALVARRNARSVWRINTEAFPGEHDSTFPAALVRRCLLAGSGPGDLVADPFGGTGTVAAVAEGLGRRWALCDADERARDWTAARLAAGAGAGDAPAGLRQLTIFDALAAAGREGAGVG